MACHPWRGLFGGETIMQKSYFFIADLLGFSNIVRNSSHDQMEQKIMIWIGLVQKAKEFAEIEQIQLISDTLFASAGDSKEDFIKLRTLDMI